MIIYKITNLKNNKIYVGQDTKNNPKYYGSGTYLKRAIKKYGKRNFKKEILERCKTTEELNQVEKHWIKKLNSKNKKIGYNLTDGGDGAVGYQHTMETKMKMSISHKNMSNETKQKLSKSLIGNKNSLGYKHTDESRKNMSESKIGKKHTEETKRKLSKLHKGKQFTEEHRKNLSKAQMGNKNCLGHKHTEETKRKLSISNKGKSPWNKGLTKETDERVKLYSQKSENSRKGKCRLIETKLKISKTMKTIKNKNN